jgi:hypothetical protein
MRMGAMRSIAAIIAIGGMAGVVTSGQSKEGSVCIAPAVLMPPPEFTSPNIPVCESGRVSVRIDALTVPWPQQKESRAVEHLDLGVRHRVTVLCDGKPQQSFSFRFTTFKSAELCLFLNDLYQTVQLWERERAPWCKCS